MKKVLIVQYSQSGQLEAVARSIAGPLQQDDAVDVHTLRLESDQAWPFPWGFWQFLDAFPECVYLDPPANKPWQAEPPYDLVIVCYTVWFLSPAPPITAFLQSDAGRKCLRDTPVITVTACRNMWMQAQEQVRQLLESAGARHCDHVALTDPGPAMATFITTPRWMLTGRRDAFLGLPPAGLTESQIDDASRFGRAIATALADGTLDGRRPVLHGLGAAPVDPALLASETIGRRSFRIWGGLIRAVGKPGAVARRPVLAVYVCFLLLLIVTVVPISMLLRALLRPLMKRRMDAAAARFAGPSGAGTGRLEEFA